MRGSVFVATAVVVVRGRLDAAGSDAGVASVHETAGVPGHLVERHLVHLAVGTEPPRLEEHRVMVVVLMSVLVVFLRLPVVVRLHRFGFRT